MRDLDAAYGRPVSTNIFRRYLRPAKTPALAAPSGGWARSDRIHAVIEPGTVV